MRWYTSRSCSRPGAVWTPCSSQTVSATTVTVPLRAGVPTAILSRQTAAILERMEALIDADARQKRALFDAEDRWRAQTASGPGRVRRTRKEAAERAKATVAARRGGG